ncbi:hypothetical protein [Streptomyces sp. ID05-47C]|uniref:hypothetical protein n=1 Tax=Streptomyces sp. ID05-47C TaxID=3028665 RepID=UPI0029BDD25F|nr:hypothetical protein [Streptomyces sp. ID05-47C]MDX3569298.1 hypothetical protein [Streptomyces sp. ID05-47C]
MQDGLAGDVRRPDGRPDGTIVPGPATPPWKGLNKPRRQEAVAYAINNRPRKILGWKTPAEIGYLAPVAFEQRSITLVIAA